jgi:ubiquinone/menaquinone biosynthesis C-methylase UbiE
MQGQHYRGLIAEWYDDWLKEDTAHRDFFSGFFHGFQGQVLELACGTGRLLIPVAESGVTIHGLDSSQHMLDVLLRKVADLNIEGIELYNQPMEEFSLPTQYDAIFVGSGSFQLLTSPESTLHSLECIREHLTDGGFFLTDIFIPWDDIIAQRRDSYHVTRDVERSDGQRSFVLERFEIDLSKQVKHGTYRYEFYKDKHLKECITDDLSIRWYWKDEFLNVLQRAGFTEVELLTGSSLYEEGHRYVFKASK